MVLKLRAVFIILTGLFLHSEAKEKKPSTGESVAVTGPAKVLGVDEYMSNVDRYKGPVNIKGVVSTVSPKHQMLGLIDTGEFESCKVVTCAQLTLPVFWTGKMPHVKETVVVEGEAKQKNKRLAIGGFSLTGFLVATGCFLVGCCGSPMLVVYLNLFGAALSLVKQRKDERV
jgi:hypothetical protein